MNKVLFIICDGLSDRPISKLKGLTPLEAAKTKNLDYLTKKGICGLMYPIDIGIRPGSDVAHLSLFGYDPYKYYFGRGPFEAEGIGLKIKPGDIALRGNIATVNNQLVVIDRRAGRVDLDHEVIEELNEIKINNIEFHLKKGTGHRLAVVLKGQNLDHRVSDSDPHFINQKVQRIKPVTINEKTRFTAKILNKFSKLTHELLKNHPLNAKRRNKGVLEANFILLRGAGIIPKYENFKQKYGFNAACIAGAGLYKGISRVLGMKIVEVGEATGKPDTNIIAKFKKAKKLLKKFNFVFVHVKGADVLAEDGDYLGKVKFIEKLDHAFSIFKNLKQTLLVITADHSTSSIHKIHTADPVPLLLVGDHLRIDQVKTMGEREFASGKLGYIKGINLMSIILDALGKAPLFGA